MALEDLAVWAVVALALGFDYTNGFHDAANSIATVVSTRVLSPPYAVAWAALFKFIALPVFETHVANTIAKDVVVQDVLTIGVVFAGLIGAIGWNLITFFLGLPTSSSHALVGDMAFSLGHGGNDAQKTMGIILAVLIASDHLPANSDVPLWVVLSAHAAIGAGTLAGGWRIVKTMGSRITRLQPVGGMAAETGAAVTLFFASANGIPVSTTHTITGAIVGVGASQRLSAVRWGVAGRVVWAWILTIPGAGLVAAVVSVLVDVAS